MLSLSKGTSDSKFEKTESLDVLVFNLNKTHLMTLEAS